MDQYQNPINLPLPNDKEIADYIKVYNNSIALLEDPNNLTRANFDAYKHMQDEKLKKLKNALDSFPTNPNQSNNPIRSIKNLKTSVALNVEPYPNPEGQTVYPTNYIGNGASKYPNYLIYGNNGCLEYSKGDPSKKTAPSWGFKPCNANTYSSESNQRFNMQQINDMSTYNNAISNNNITYKINDSNSTIFGFYVVNPESDPSQCLQLNRDGLTIMPCNMDSSQRFKPYYHSIK